MGLMKNRYVGRTFIAPGDRLDKVRIKLSAIEDAVRGKRLVLIDDSIVRGTTSGRIVGLQRDPYEGLFAAVSPSLLLRDGY